MPTFGARYAIPAALILTDIEPILLFIACVGLNLLVIPFIFIGLDMLTPHLRRRYRWIESIFMWFYRREHGRKGGFPALVAFVATPIPGSGAYTGALMAYLFGFDRGPAAAAIAIGVILSATLTTLAALGIISLVGIL